MEKKEKILLTESFNPSLTPEEAREQLQVLKEGVLEDIINRISWLHERGKRAPFIETEIDSAFRRLERIEKYLDPDNKTDREMIVELKGQLIALERVNKALPPERLNK